MKKVLLATGLFFALLLGAARAESVTYIERFVDGIAVKIICVDLNSPRVSIVPTLAAVPGQGETFDSMVERLKPAAAINGTYFCVRTFKPVGAVFVEGKRKYRSPLGTAFALTKDNRAFIFEHPWSAKLDHRKYKMVLSAGPGLLKDGVISLDPYLEGFRDGRIYAPAPRSALGLKKGNKILLVTIQKNVYLGRLAYIMKELGCTDSMALDGGSSSALCYRGKVLLSPARRMSNILAVYEEEKKIVAAANPIRVSPAPRPLFHATPYPLLADRRDSHAYRILYPHPSMRPLLNYEPLRR